VDKERVEVDQKTRCQKHLSEGENQLLFYCQAWSSSLQAFLEQANKVKSERRATKRTAAMKEAQLKKKTK